MAVSEYLGNYFFVEFFFMNFFVHPSIQFSKSCQIFEEYISTNKHFAFSSSSAFPFPFPFKGDEGGASIVLSKG